MAWASLLIACALVLAGKAAADWRMRHLQANAAKQQASAVAERDQIWQQFTTARQRLRKSATPDEALASIAIAPASDRVEQRRNGLRRVVTYDAPELGLLLEFDFPTDVGTQGPTWSSSASNRSVPYPTPRPLAIEETVQRLARILVPVVGGVFTPLGALPWFALLAWGVFDRDRRPWLGFALTAWAFFCAAVCLAVPVFSLTLSNLFSNDRLFWGAVMLAISLPVAWRWRPSAIRDPLACRVCDYHLAGNTSGFCPECGTQIDAMTRSRVEAAMAN